MPYATRKMIKYMKEHKLNTSEGGGEASGANEPEDSNKKIREQPNTVDPPTSSKPKSADIKASAMRSSSKITSKKSKSKIKSADSAIGTKDASSKVAAKSSTKLKKSRSKQSIKSSKSKQKMKIIPDSEMALKPVIVGGMNEEHEMTFDQKKVQFIQMLLKANVKKLKETEATEPPEEGKKNFNMYDFKDKKVPLEHRKPHSAKALYQCLHKSFGDLALVVKVYDASEKAYDPHHSHYLKMIRHLSKKHPNIVQTWDVIAKDDCVYVFQELAPFGNMVDYIKFKGGAPLPEKEVQLVACQMRMGMDFLGDMGLAHRSITPYHILVMHKNMRIKLTGFRKAIIYYNDKKSDLNYQPCRPLEKKKTAGNDYHAPESYGDHKKEFFDPVAADVWSAGATLYNLLTGKFPYNCSKNSPKIENEIQGNIRALKVSDSAKSALGFMLITDANKRFSVQHLSEHPWFVQK